MNWPRERNYQSDGLEEECESMTASHIASLLLEGKSSENLCLLCLCGESLLGVEDSVYLGNEYIDTTISIKMLLDMLCIIPTECASQKGMFQKVCAICVNRLSQMYMFIFKCQRNICAFKEIELHVLHDNVASQNKHPASIEIPSDNIYDYAIDFQFVGPVGTAPGEDVKFNVKTEPLETVPIHIEIEKRENVMLNDDVQRIAANQLIHSCNICDIHFKSADKLSQHMRHHQYTNVIRHITQCTPICICCLKSEQNLRCLSKKISISEILNDHGDLSKNEETPAIMIKNTFNVMIGETSDSILICDSCINHVIQAFKFYNALKESLSCFKALMRIFEESLNNTICNSDELRCVNVHIDFNTLFPTEVKSRNRKKGKNRNNINSLFVCEHCSRMFATKDGIKSHLRYSHRNILNEKHEWACTICTTLFTTKDDLEIHKEVHSEDYTTCEYCRNIFPQTKLFVRHVSLCMKKKKAYKCDLCEATFETKKSTYIHRRKHFPKKQCPLCSKWCKSVSFKRHMIKHVTRKQVNREELVVFGINITRSERRPRTKTVLNKCLICHEVSQTYSHLKTHSAKELEEFNITLKKVEQIECKYCGKTLAKMNINRHIREAHSSKFISKNKRPLPIKSFQCGQCDYKIHNRFDLEGHVNKYHLNRLPYSCDDCDKRFHNKKLRAEHMKRCHAKSQLCPHCGKCFGSKSDLDRHALRHAEGSVKHIKGTLQCDQCDYSTYVRDQMEAHMNKYHLRIRPYSCDICGKSFYTRNVCARHKRIHSRVKSGKSEMCPHCGKLLSSAKTVKTHIAQQHGTEKPRRKYYLQCDDCDYKTSAKINLEGHINKQHLKIQPYPCNICGKRFHTKYKCAEHEHTHAQLKPEECPHCGNRFGSKKALVSHVRLHTGERPYKCNECDDSFVNGGRLQHHIRSKHAEKDTPCPFCSKLFHRVRLRHHIRCTHEARKNVVKKSKKKIVA